MFTYLAYSMMTLCKFGAPSYCPAFYLSGVDFVEYETVPAFEETRVECLGDLSS